METTAKCYLSIIVLPSVVLVQFEKAVGYKSLRTTLSRVDAQKVIVISILQSRLFVKSLEGQICNQKSNDSHCKWEALVSSL